ncbi:hypothetical protein DAEQUDRAFT_728416 [Daedalea quercina L-15889]|uniref:Transcription initiation factor IIF subunit beta n=1 Tax=Daedalea quercina L-15889 TaxID=1314783 RepID=A0A165P996_9APHY|nr:hypothetical protein DAEQUDRAFT_728416 [Daedalea quercina L-15889]
MDEPIVEEEDKKQFDSINGSQDAETEPDPDESLIMDSGNGRVWLVKIPKYLMERWQSVTEDNVHLATIRVYHGAKSASGKSPRILLALPPDPENPGQNEFEGDVYEMDMVQESVENQVVIAEREKEPPPVPGTRARTTVLTGRVKHECNLRPMFSERYRQRLRMRTIAANTPKKQIMRIEDAGVGGRGNINMLTSGVANTTPLSLGQRKQKPAKGQFERMARMPRNQLLDELFRLFQERERWSIKVLRDRTQQPEAYLKEVLTEIADLNRSGEFNGTWELKQTFRGEGVKAEHVPGPSGVAADTGAADGVKEEDFDDFDEDDEEDMEEVS